MRGKWTEIYTRREKDIGGHLDASDGREHGQGWACTCGCNKRIHGRRHSEGPPREECNDGYVPSNASREETYRTNYDLIKWDDR